ncbi:MAG: hypothetical protein JNK79_04350 [Chitinophagaceae bacterium]|nr:hypothetical protein [Chitinophagaceae bacterium]
MKHLGTHPFRLFAVMIIVLVVFSCRRTVYDRRPNTSNSPESREYFGFVLNGRHFVSEERIGNVSGECTYAASYDSASTFRIQSNHSATSCIGGTIEIILDSIDIKENNTYAFGTPGSKKNSLTCYFTNDCSKPALYLTTRDNNFGFVKIKKYRPDIKVISGVFSCIVISDDGTSYQIADGYFDRHYSPF